MRTTTSGSYVYRVTNTLNNYKPSYVPTYTYIGTWEGNMLNNMIVSLAGNSSPVIAHVDLNYLPYKTTTFRSGHYLVIDDVTLEDWNPDASWYNINDPVNVAAMNGNHMVTPDELLTAMNSGYGSGYYICN